MNRKLRILIIVGILLIVAIITKIALADSNGDKQYTQDEIIEDGNQPISQDCYTNGSYSTGDLIEGSYPLDTEDIEELKQRYTKGDASTLFSDMNQREVIDAGIINADDATQILKWYAEQRIMGTTIPTKAQMYVCDVNSDGIIDDVDAIKVLQFVVNVLINKTDNFEDFINSNNN